MFFLLLACSSPTPSPAAPITPPPVAALAPKPLTELEKFREGAPDAHELKIDEARERWDEIRESYPTAGYGASPADIDRIGQMLFENAGCSCTVLRQGMRQGWEGMYGSAFVTTWQCESVRQIDGVWWVATGEPFDDDTQTIPGRCEARIRAGEDTIDKE